MYIYIGHKEFSLKINGGGALGLCLGFRGQEVTDNETGLVVAGGGALHGTVARVFSCTHVHDWKPEQAAIKRGRQALE